jgi:hypothetical protein
MEPAGRQREYFSRHQKDRVARDWLIDQSFSLRIGARRDAPNRFRSRPCRDERTAGEGAANERSSS